MPFFIQQVTKDDLNIFIEDINPFRYEFTITYNPKYIESIEYALTMTPFIYEDLVRFCNRNQAQGDYAFNYVVEYQSNGYPHIHGTLFVGKRFTPQSVNNLEKAFIRKYGRSDIYSTGQVDKFHKNDHFEGTWQQYIEKEQTPIYFYSEFRY